MLIGIAIGAAAGTTLPLLAEKPPLSEAADKDYEEGFRDGRTNGYHAAISQMEGCFK